MGDSLLRGFGLSTGARVLEAPAGAGVFAEVGLFVGVGLFAEVGLSSEGRLITSLGSLVIRRDMMGIMG